MADTDTTTATGESFPLVTDPGFQTMVLVHADSIVKSARKDRQAAVRDQLIAIIEIAVYFGSKRGAEALDFKQQVTDAIKSGRMLGRIG